MHFKLSAFVYILLFLTVLNACSVLTGHDSSLKPQPFGKLEHNSEWYSDQLSASDPEYNYDWQILLARAYSHEGNTRAASEVLKQMRETAVTPLQGNIADIIEAQVKARSGNVRAARQLLDSVSVISLPPGAATYYHSLNGRVSESGGLYLQAGQSYLSLAENLPESERPQAYQRASAALAKASPKDLVAGYKQSQDKISRGFMQYFLIAKNRSDASRARLMEKFAEKYPDHPLTANAKAGSRQTGAAPAGGAPDNIGGGDTIAVFLPLTGPYAKIIGQPVKMGILHSYRDRGISVKLKFYDTSAGTITSLYRESQNDGARVIIGPIIKEEVDQLIALNPAVPVIALNTAKNLSEDAAGGGRVFYLTLTPENDMYNAMLEMTKDRVQKPVIIAPKNERGDRVAGALNSFWLRQNGSPVNLCYYGDMNSIEGNVNGCLNGYNSYDGVYIYGTPVETAKIRDSARGYIGDSALYYAGSKSNDGLSQTAIAQSLKGIKLGDQPWMLKDSNAKSKVQALLPKANGDTLRSFAIGYDALNLALHLNDMITGDDSSIRGLSGDISIGPDGRLRRIITWEIMGN